jgi:Domain of unknown function (DUF4145)
MAFFHSRLVLQGIAMTVDRKVWQFEISEKYVPDWPCPGCGSTSLKLVEGSFHAVSDGNSQRHSHHPDWEWEFDTGRFVCLLQCSKPTCKESCAVSGNYSVTVDQDEGGYPGGKPSSIVPPPPIIAIPKKCPEPVRQEIAAAFSLFWCDEAACLNRVRNALELLLTELKVPNSKVNNNKRVRHSLHTRIELLETKRPKLKDICEQMMAVKHLGNAGSHAGKSVAVEDVLDGFDILERVLHDMFSDADSRLAKTVKQINKRKGPRRGE